MAVILRCSVQNFKSISQLTWMFLKNEFSQNLSGFQTNILKACCNMRYSSETKLISPQTFFVHNFHSVCSIVLKFCTEHSNMINVLCANFKIVCATEKKWQINKILWDLIFKMSLEVWPTLHLSCNIPSYFINIWLSMNIVQLKKSFSKTLPSIFLVFDHW